jgi:hypothetical protein
MSNVNENKKQGWVRLYRSIDKYITNPRMLQFIIWCLTKANRHESYTFPFNGQLVSLKEGEFVTGRKEASAELAWTEDEYRSTKGLAEKAGFITSKITNKFTIISVTNWAQYQHDTEVVKEKSPAESPAESPTSPQQIPTYKKKEVKSIPVREIVDLYHDILPDLRRVKVIAGSLEKQISARWKEETKRQALDYWREFFEYVHDCCPWLTDPKGKENGWTADLRWLVKSENFAKVIEGRYENQQDG